MASNYSGRPRGRPRGSGRPRSATNDARLDLADPAAHRLGWSVEEDDETPTIGDNVHAHVTREEYLEMRDRFEKNHFYDIGENKVVEVHGQGVLDYMTIAHAHGYLDRDWRFVYDESNFLGGYVPFFMLWMKDPERRCARRVSRLPSTDPDDFYVPLVFACDHSAIVSEEAARAALSMYEDLVGAAFNDNPIMCDYFHNYVAHMLQRPLDLPGVSITLTGAKGSGKDTLLRFIVSHLLGRGIAVSYDKVESLFNTFDVGSMNTIAIHIEELSERSLRPYAKQLRALITADVRTFNNKGSTILHNVPNYTRVFASSNEQCPMPVYDDGQMDRRYVFGHMSPRFVGPHPIWAKVYHATDGLFTPVAARAVGAWLRKRDLSEFNPRVLPQDGEEHEEHREPLQMYIEDCWDPEDDFRTTKDILHAARDFCRSQSINPDKSLHDTLSLGKALAHFVTLGAITKQVRRARIAYYRKIDQKGEVQGAGAGGAGAAAVRSDPLAHPLVEYDDDDEPDGRGETDAPQYGMVEQYEDEEQGAGAGGYSWGAGAGAGAARARVQKPEESAETIYVLQLAGGYYYVGKSRDVSRRLEEHRRGEGCAWTSKHALECELETRPARSRFDEDNVTKEYMDEYGIDRVRGGTYSQVVLDADSVRLLQKELWAMGDKCTRCGRGGHFVKACTELTTAAGELLDVDGDGAGSDGRRVKQRTQSEL